MNKLHTLNQFYINLDLNNIALFTFEKGIIKIRKMIVIIIIII